MSSIKILVKNTGLLFLSQMISYILAFFYTLYSARYLGASDFGIISFATAITGLFCILTDLGIGTLTTREVARDYSRTYKYLGNTGSIKIVLSILTVILLTLFVEISNYQETTRIVVYIMGLASIITAISGVFTSMFRAYEEMEYQSISEILSAVSLFIGILLCIYFKYNVIAVATVYLIANSLVLIYNFIVCSKKYGLIHLQWDTNFLKKLIYDSFPLAITSIFALVAFKIDTVMLNVMLTSSATGWYTAAFNLMQALIFIPTVYSTAIMPVFSKLFITSQDTLKVSYEKSLKYLAILSVPIAVGTTILAEKIILFMYGTGYIEAVPVLRTVIWALPAIFFSYILGTSIASINKQHETVKATFLCMVISIIGNAIFIELLGCVGAAIATVITEIGMVIFYMFIMHRNGMGVSISKIFIKPILASIIMGITIYVLNLDLFSSFIIGAIVYFIIIILIKTFDDKDKELLKQVLPTKLLNIIQR
ncbi:MAG: flippase [Methanobacteriaceae archaeon]|nr:flippase [Methanobacteriaceae archaeon]